MKEACHGRSSHSRGPRRRADPGRGTADMRTATALLDAEAALAESRTETIRPWSSCSSRRAHGRGSACSSGATRWRRCCAGTACRMGS